MSGDMDRPLGPQDRQHGPEYAPVCRGADPVAAPKLAPLNDHVDLGKVQVGTEQTFVIAVPVLQQGERVELSTAINRSRSATNNRSAFRDRLGLDADTVLEQSEADSLSLVSPAEVSITGYGPTPPVQVRFRPWRAGRFRATVTISAVGQDGASDVKQVRLVGTGYEVEKKADPEQEPRISDDIRRQDQATAIARAIPAKRPSKPIVANSFDDARKAAENRAEDLGKKEQAGARLAGAEIRKFERAPRKPELLDQLIEVAFMIGVSGIAGVVAKYVAKNLGAALARPPQDSITIHPGRQRPPAPGTLEQANEGAKAPGSYFRNKAPNPDVTVEPKRLSDDQLITMITDGTKEGIKGSAKVARKAVGPSDEPDTKTRSERSQWDGRKSTDLIEDLVHRYEMRLADRELAYKETVRVIGELLESVEPAKAQSAMESLGNGMNSVAETADQFHARALGLQWIATVARQSLGDERTKLSDGTTAETTRLDQARSYGPRSWYKETSVPTHDGVLDIHVDVPPGMVPVEAGGIEVRGASITGVSQPVADRLINTDLRNAGIPIRFVVKGHPALITRDEVGRVRINGALLTQDVIDYSRRTKAGMRLSPALMHRGAKFLVDVVLAKTLEAWGISGVQLQPNRIKTDDTSQEKYKK